MWRDDGLPKPLAASVGVPAHKVLLVITPMRVVLAQSSPNADKAWKVWEHLQSTAEERLSQVANPQCNEPVLIQGWTRPSPIVYPPHDPGRDKVVKKTRLPCHGVESCVLTWRNSRLFTAFIQQMCVKSVSLQLPKKKSLDGVHFPVVCYELKLLLPICSFIIAVFKIPRRRSVPAIALERLVWCMLGNVLWH